MPTKAKAKTKGSDINQAQAKTRVLLSLWDIGDVEAQVSKSELTKRLLRKTEKTGDYQRVFEQLEKEGAIALATKSSSVKVALTPEGLQMLETGLKSPDFQFSGKQVGAKDFNALLKWIRHLKSAVSVPSAPAKPVTEAIASYDKFKYVALDVYDQLNRDYNLDDLVPIYRIRREIGDRISRSHFNEWLLEMQANDIFQLMGGEMPDMTPDKAEDSITTELSGLRYYAKRLNP